jgi:hypothetical protein
MKTEGSDVAAGPATMKLLGLSGVLACALSVGCVPVQALPLSRPATTGANDLQVQVGSVSASNTFLAQAGGPASVLSADVTVTNHSGGTALLELDRATLLFEDPGGELRPVTLGALAAGKGITPDAIPLSKRPVPIGAAPGETVAFWVAFQDDERLEETDIPRRIILRIPVSGGAAPVDVLLADPATARPRWELPMVRHATYAGVSASGTFDEASFGIVRSSGKSVVGPVVLGPSFSIGFRGGEVRGERERTIVCCDFGAAFDLSLPILRGPMGAVGPYLGYQALFAIEDGRIDKATWHGPAIGLQIFGRPIDPRTAGALPIRTVRTPLGYMSTTLAYTHWFRRGDVGGSPGFVAIFEHTLPEL